MISNVKIYSETVEKAQK